MSQLSKQDLKAENQLSFPNNNNGAITPSDLRAFNVDMIDSTVNQTAFDSFSGSVASQFSNLTQSVDPSITGSSLITASFASQTITFTKGDGSTFGLFIPDASGSTINTGSFATTGSNTFVGVQNFNSEITASNTFINGNLVVNPTTATQLLGNTDIGAFLYVGGGLTLNSSAAAAWVGGTGSINSHLNISGNVLPSVNGQGDLGNDSFRWNSVTVNGQIKGSSVNTSGRSNLGTIILGDETFPLNFLSDREIVADGTGANTHLYYGTSSADVTALRELVYTQSGSNADFGAVSASFDSRINAITGSGGGSGSVPDGTVSSSAQILNYGIFATTGSNIFTGNQTITTGGNTTLNVISTDPVGQSNLEFQAFQSNFRAYGNFSINNNGQFGGSGSVLMLASNNFIGLGADSGIRVGATSGAGNAVDNGFISMQVRSGSLSLAPAGSTNTTASLTHLSSSSNTGNINLVFKPNANIGSTIISGSGNIFVNPTIPGVGRVNYIGGVTNLFLNGASQNLPQITGSAASVSGNRPTMNSNVILGPHSWTINQAANPGAHTYNHNVLVGGTQTNFNLTGNTGNVTFNNNMSVGGTITLNSPSRSIAEINAGVSGSNPLNITNNTLAGTLAYNGPVSSSTHTITTNNIAGILTLNIQSGSRAYTLQNNNVNGFITINDNTVFAPTLGSTNNISNNSIVGNVNITNRASASISMNANILGGGTIINDADYSLVQPIGNRGLSMANNITFGTLTIYTSGSIGAVSGSRLLNTNILGGLFNSASLVGDGLDKNMVATAMIGGGLNVYGSSTVLFGGAPGNVGSAFFGRYNAENGNRAKTSETVFAVGTGTSGSAGIARKTGFLIDSGSNTFVEGTFNVSGSTILSGSTFINNLQNGITADVVTYDTTTGELRKASLADITSASFDAAEFWSTTTQSGSAGVSGSITFNNSGSVAGVSVVNNSQITLSQAGAYNIQFSAQLETSAGADTVYMWFKKNGNNISDSASKAVLANNTAQIMTVNILDEGVANDYYELAYQTLNGNATVLYEGASGNIPAIPSVILTVTQIR